LRPNRGSLPPFVTLPWIVSHPAAPGGVAPGQNGGWMAPGHDPFVVAGDPNATDFQVAGLWGSAELTTERLRGRQDLLQRLETNGDPTGLQQKAFDLLGAPAARQAFDLRREPPRVRDRYGRNIHGQCVLLARRLIEAGVRLVCVNWHQDGHNFWDTHGNNFMRLKRDLMPPTDWAFSALLDDLSARGLLEETLVVWVGEFGRTPRVTPGNAGREHWPHCYSAVLAGGGVRGGQVVGSSDRHGAYPTAQPVTPADLTATVYQALGVEAETMVKDREGRPIRLTEGTPLRSIFG
jgi:hypothetical protein